jgi:branched-chain amino acid transport system ATP-binding protein
VIDVSGLTVRFGGVVSLDEMTVTFPTGICGLIGPNGAGKTTFFNVLSGFVSPAAGSIHASDGTDLLALPDYQRARWGLRRTFQTEQAIESLSVYDNVVTVFEHSPEARGPAGKAAARRAAVEEALELVGLSAAAQQLVRTLPAKERRFIEVARAVVGQPRLVLLDEPGAGLPDEETAQLSRVIRAVPERTGATVILVDHDMELVQACCDWTAVLDFGRLLATGPTAEVLTDDRVLAAYLGGDDALEDSRP